MMQSNYQQTLLIVEPDQDTLSTIADILKKEPYTFITVQSGKLGLEQIESAKRPYALIISAQSLPDMAGTAFLEKAQTLSPNSIRFLITVCSELEILT